MAKRGDSDLSSILSQFSKLEGKKAKSPKKAKHKPERKKAKIRRKSHTRKVAPERPAVQYKAAEPEPIKQEVVEEELPERPVVIKKVQPKKALPAKKVKPVSQQEILAKALSLKKEAPVKKKPLSKTSSRKPGQKLTDEELSELKELIPGLHLKRPQSEEQGENMPSKQRTVKASKVKYPLKKAERAETSEDLQESEKHRLAKIMPGSAAHQEIEISHNRPMTNEEDEEPEEIEEEGVSVRQPKQVVATKTKLKSAVKKVKDSPRVPTGIPNFDKLIEGGIKRHSTNLVAGGAGAGKTIFAMQFLVTGIVKYKEPAIYITFEEKKERFYEDMLRFGWDLAKYEREGMFAFVEYAPQQVKTVLVEGGGTIESLISDMNAKRFVIDSITSFALLYEDELERKEAALDLIDLINVWGCTALLTSQDESSSGIFINAAMEFEVDSIILLYYVKIKGIRQRCIEVLKMRGTKHEGKTFAFKINQNGITVDTHKSIIF